MKKHAFLIPLTLVYMSCPQALIYQQNTGSSDDSYKEYPISNNDSIVLFNPETEKINQKEETKERGKRFDGQPYVIDGHSEGGLRALAYVGYIKKVYGVVRGGPVKI